MSLSSSAAAAPRGRPRHPAGRALARLWRFGVTLLLLLWGLFLLAWLVLQWGILPRLDDWRGHVEAQATRALGQTVQIGRLQARSSGWVPAFELDDVVLRDGQGREALRLPKLAVALSVPALLAGQLRLQQLLVDGARLEVRRDAAGRWHVAGLDVDDAPALEGGDAAGWLDWLFSQHELIVRGGELRWLDQYRDAPPLQLRDLLLVLRNSGRRHELRLDATPPDGWGQRFTLRAQAREPMLAGLARSHRPGDWRQWQGSLYAELPLADAARLRRHVDLPVDLQRGMAALRAWVDFDNGLARQLTLDAALRDVSVRFDRHLEPVAFERLETRVQAERSADGAALSLQGLQFVAADGRRWAPSSVAVRWQQRQSAAPALDGADGAHRVERAPMTGGELSADRLDLAPLVALAERLPLAAGLRAMLQQSRPAGTVEQLNARWQGAADAPRGYQVKARLRGLSIAAAPAAIAGEIGRPGLRGADLDISADEGGGQASVAIADGALEVPGVFADASVPLRRFAANLRWRIDNAAGSPRHIGLKVERARFANDDADGEFDASWESGPAPAARPGLRGGMAGPGNADGGGAGSLDLKGVLRHGQAARVARYLPLGIGADVRQWVAGAVQGGEVQDVNFQVRGNLADFPFTDARAGVFRIGGRLNGVTLAPVSSARPSPSRAAPSWPAFGGIGGELVFERGGMWFRQVGGRLWDTELSGVQGRIADLSPQAVLEIDGLARGPAADLLRYVEATPLADWTAGALAQARADGTSELKLALRMPLSRLANTSLQASVQLPGNALSLRPGLPALAGGRGTLLVSERGVQLQALRGQALGGELQIDGGSQADGSLRIVVAGQASADGLRHSKELPALLGAEAAPLLGRLAGQAAYRLELAIRHGQPELLLTSPLQGMAIDLPAPLHKTAAAALPLRLQTTLQGSGAVSANAAPRELLRLELGALQLALLLDISGDSPRLLRSSVAYGSPLPDPVAGGRAVLAFDRIDLDAWQALWPDGAAAAAGAGSDAAAPVANVALRAAQVQLAGRRLDNLTLNLQRVAVPGEEGWHAALSADQASGTIDYREPRRAGDTGRIRARLARLSLPQDDAEQMTGMLDRAPVSVPALDIEVADFELRGRALGRLTVEAVNRPSAADDGRREWRLDRLQLDNADARLRASGGWGAVARGSRRRMELDFKLEVGDAGALLDRLGFGAVVRGGKGQLQGLVRWDGSPLALDVGSLGGGFRIALESGRFLKADAGAARLLGVLSLQALPRRLSLDFRDLFDAGFAFDDFSGDVRIVGGVASTNNLRMRGLQAAVLMAGQADIGRETQDLQVVVLPELNTASASLAYAAINPAIGLGALVGQWLLREPLRQASAREFRISGRWDDPQVQRVQRGMLDPLPAAATPAPPRPSSPP